MDEQLLRDDQQNRPHHKASGGRGKARLTYAQYEEAKRCFEIYKTTPSISQLARRWGMPVSTVANSVKRGIKRYDTRTRQDALQGP